jgi:hypothetical protein
MKRRSLIKDFIESANSGHGADAGAAILLFGMAVFLVLFGILMISIA